MIPYKPRETFRPFHERDKRWAILVIHRRGGKTVACINDLIKAALTCDREQPRFAYIAPYRIQAKAVAWDYLKRYTAVIPGAKANESELRVDFPNGGRVTLYGSDNYDALRGVYLDGVIMDEFADMEPEAWHTVIRPALSDRGGWAVFIGTPKGRNEFFRIYDKARLDPEWFTMFLPASASGIIDDAELSSARKAMGEQSYAREYECDFSAATDNSIYGPQINAMRSQNRICDFKHSIEYPAVTFWDIGQSDFTSIWLCQFIGRDIQILDYFCRSHEMPSFYAQKIVDWERQYNFRVSMNYLPHDADALGASGKTYRTYLKEAGLTALKVVPRTPDVWLGINEMRAIFNRCYIHSTNCSKGWIRGERTFPSGIDCLEYYHSKEQVQGGAINDNPVHDEFSHGADSLRIMAEAYRLGMIDGAVTARHVGVANGETPYKRKILRGPQPDSYIFTKRERAVLR